MKRALIVIPARMRSTRLPNKPLADIGGVPMIVHVWRRATAAEAGRVVVATDAEEIAAWRMPDGMTSEVHAFDAREGGKFRISLTHDALGPIGSQVGKSTAQTDTYHGHFARLVPDREVVEVLAFESADPAMQGEMTITYRLNDTDDGTELQAVHEGVPAGIAPADNETGWRMAFDRLARLVEGG